MRETVNVHFVHDDGLSEIEIRANVIFTLEDNGFSHPWGYEPSYEVVPEKTDIELIECYRSSPYGAAPYMPQGAFWERLKRKIIEKAINKL